MSGNNAQRAPSRRVRKTKKDEPPVSEEPTPTPGTALNIVGKVSRNFWGPSYRATEEDMQNAVAESRRYWSDRLDQINAAEPKPPMTSQDATTASAPLDSGKSCYPTESIITPQSSPEATSKKRKSDSSEQSELASPAFKRVKGSAQIRQTEHFEIFEDDPPVMSGQATEETSELGRVRGWNPINTPSIGQVTSYDDDVDQENQPPRDEEEFDEVDEEDIDPWYWICNSMDGLI
ncbi:hypothetical protein PVAG01_00465 [Phlyctema vagabunda]|uniref:Uncharacterized protein n=1 Tax=Phlyctema vagabunda TaxID=108571 RepID=A0ABR4PUN8_9HELO